MFQICRRAHVALEVSTVLEPLHDVHVQVITGALPAGILIQALSRNGLTYYAGMGRS